MMKVGLIDDQSSIVIDHLSKVYRGKRGNHVVAVDDLSLTIARGEVFGFLGPNGAGKSTTIKILMGLVAPSGGEVLLCGRSVSAVTARQRVGYLPENPAFYDFLTGREYLLFVAGAFAIPRQAAKSTIDRWLDRLDLMAAASRPIRSYSKGMVQRLGLAQALFHDPAVVILDEPMSGLDPMGRALVKEIIRDLKQQGKTVFFSTHITTDVEAVCDRVGVVASGRLLAVDTVASIMQIGIEGYVVQVDRPDGGSEELCVAKDGLQQKMQQLWAEGASIQRIEPQRQDLEGFFLKLVGRDKR